MKIASSSIALQSSHMETRRLEISEQLEMWVGERNPGGNRAGDNALPSSPPAAGTRVSLSDQALATQAPAEVARSTDQETDLEPRMWLLRTMIEILTGRPIRLLKLTEAEAPDLPAAAPPTAGPAGNAGKAPQAAGFGVDYQFRASYHEYERVSFGSSGTVRTADGRQIDFQLDFEMERAFSQSVSVDLRAGDARLKDPLVLDFAGPAAALSDLRFEFDLDADGQLDQLPMLAGGSGFLAFDLDGNGRIDDGRELFGATTGDGFSELAALDDDGNGWIDENDAAYRQLSVWRPTADGGGQMRSLAEAGVGALYLGRVATPFALRDAANQTLGMMRASGIYLREDGTAGSISQVDLSV